MRLNLTKAYSRQGCVAQNIISVGGGLQFRGTRMSFTPSLGAGLVKASKNLKASRSRRVIRRSEMCSILGRGLSNTGARESPWAPAPRKTGPPFLQTGKFGVHRPFLTLGVHRHPPTLPKFLIGSKPFLFTLTLPLGRTIFLYPVKFSKRGLGSQGTSYNGRSRHMQ